MKKSRPGRISAIVTTYNRPKHLERCLASLEAQTVRPDEVVIADDGSRPGCIEEIRAIMERLPFPTLHVWQEDHGFRIAANRNNGVRHSTGDYLFFTDGDAILLPETLEEHLRRSSPHRWVAGNMIRLTAEETARLTPEAIRARRIWEVLGPIDEERMQAVRERTRRLQRQVRRARLWASEYRLRKIRPLGVQLSMYREAYLAVNGCDETFDGHGWEDYDLGLRLQLAGVRACFLGEEYCALHQYHEPLPPALDNKSYFYRDRRGEYFARRGIYACNGGDEPARARPVRFLPLSLGRPGR